MAGGASNLAKKGSGFRVGHECGEWGLPCKAWRLGWTLIALKQKVRGFDRWISG